MRLPRLPRKNPVQRIPQEFSAGKVHTPRLRFLRWLEGFLILLVLVGTALLFLNRKEISLQEILRRVPATLSPKQASVSSPLETSFEDSLLAELGLVSIEVQKSEPTAEGNLLVTSKDKTQFYFDTKKDPASQVRTLQTVLAKARIESKKIRRVDFRFEKLVVEY
jgi:hypothetical protein